MSLPIVVGMGDQWGIDELEDDIFVHCLNKPLMTREIRRIAASCYKIM